ncbi:MAG TPA: hypothetical protein VMV49_01715 [Candidatus Deferrimicrobium sp.]|nr:hypothetical protein [Candidatus Deferrimicrobium sp.]
MVWQLHTCFLCAGMQNDPSVSVTKEDLKDHGWGAAIAGIFTATTRMINEYADIQFTSRVYETQCLLRGDPIGEFVAEFYPKEKEVPST